MVLFCIYYIIVLRRPRLLHCDCRHLHSTDTYTLQSEARQKDNKNVGSRETHSPKGFASCCHRHVTAAEASQGPGNEMQLHPVSGSWIDIYLKGPGFSNIAPSQSRQLKAYRSLFPDRGKLLQRLVVSSCRASKRINRLSCLKPKSHISRSNETVYLRNTY